MIYKANGQASSAYRVNGASAHAAYAVDGSHVYPDSGTVIKVMTYNVGQWYYGGHVVVPADKDAAYYALQNGMIASANPDILFLEEYLSKFSATGRTAVSMLQQYFPYIHEEQGTGTVSSGKGRCICSKYPITNYTTHQYTTSGGPRYYDTCTATVNGIPITLVITHLNYNDTDSSGTPLRYGQLTELINYLSTFDRFICAGDLNTLYAKSTTEKDYINMIQPLLNAGFHLANCSDYGFLTTYSNVPTGSGWVGCLDNIVTSPNITITGATVDTTKLTDEIEDTVDHMPLIATLTL